MATCPARPRAGVAEVNVGDHKFSKATIRQLRCDGAATHHRDATARPRGRDDRRRRAEFDDVRYARVATKRGR